LELCLPVSLSRAEVRIASRTITEQKIAAAYNDAGDRYGSYADGQADGLFDFTGHYAYGDKATWIAIDQKLQALAANGAKSVRVLDLGCGPGTWLRRIATRALELGLDKIIAHGVDIADGQVKRAEEACRHLSSQIELTFEVRDIREQFREADQSVDLCLCLYGVLNHVAPGDFAAVLGEVARVTSGTFISTVRTIGSTPTIYVDSIEAARRFRQDHRLDRLDVELANGRHMSFTSHLFGTAELVGLVSQHLTVQDVCGLDIFHGRFSTDPRWNPPNAISSHFFERELTRLEQVFCREPEFIDHATHLLLVAKSQRQA